MKSGTKLAIPEYIFVFLQSGPQHGIHLQHGIHILLSPARRSSYYSWTFLFGVLQARTAVQRLLNMVHAATYLLNPHNFEAGWGPVFEDACRAALEGRTAAADVMAQLDIIFDGARDIPHVLQAVDSLTFRSCRPDVAICYYAVKKRLRGFNVDHLAVPVLVEIKRSPPRYKVSLDSGIPYNRKGRTAIRSQLRKAQKQVLAQGALFLRTRAGQKQRRVMLIAGTGRHFAYTFMSIDDPQYAALDPAQMIVNAVDTQAREEEEMWQGIFINDPPTSERESTNLPDPDEVLGYKWEGCYDVAGNDFLTAVGNYLDAFEKMLRVTYPDTFDPAFFDEVSRNALTVQKAY